MFLFEFDLIGKICSIWSFWMKYLLCQLTKSFSDCPPKNGFAMGRKLCQSQGQGEPRVATISVATLFWRRTLNHIREHTSQPLARKIRTRKSQKPGTGSILLVISTVSVASKDVGTHILCCYTMHVCDRAAKRHVSITIQGHERKQHHPRSTPRMLLLLLP